MEKFFDFFVEKLFPHAYKWWATLLIIIVLTLVFVVGLKSLEISSLSITDFYSWLICGISAILASATIKKLSSPPTCKPTEIGILLAIRTETESERLRVENDLSETIKRAIQESGTSLPFKIMVLPPRFSNSIREVKEAEFFTKKSNARFTLYGDMRTRSHEGKEFYVLRVLSLVTHAHIDQKNSQLLASEMDAVLPKEANIDCKDDLKGFELTSRQFANGSKYVIAIALFLSGKTVDAIDLLVSLNGSIALLKKQTEIPGTNQLLTLVPKRLSDFIQTHVVALLSNWRNSHEEEIIKEVEFFLNKIPVAYKNTPSALNSSAICAFVLRRDIFESEKNLKAISKQQPFDATWKYSLAFLSAYKGNLDDAYKFYRSAFNSDNSNELPVEIEEFIAWVIEIEPEKYQLNFCLALINHKKKKDLLSAKIDYELFVSSAALSYSKQIDFAKRFILEVASVACVPS